MAKGKKRTKKKKKRKIEHPLNKKMIRQSDDVLMSLHSPVMIFEWCCDCGLRHIIYLEVQRGKKKEDDRILRYITDDRWATKARKELDKLYKKHGKKKKKS